MVNKKQIHIKTHLELISLLMDMSLKEKNEPEKKFQGKLFDTYDLKGVSSYIKTKKPKKILGFQKKIFLLKKKLFFTNSYDRSWNFSCCRNT